MTESLVTIAVVPRERFSYSRKSLESILEHTDPSVPLVYVDGGSPPHVRRYLEERARERGFPLIRTAYYLFPNEARNLALREIASKYVVFVDNDVIVAPGWLDAMVRCAEETDAWVVGPIYCWENDIIHTVMGESRIEERQGKRLMVENHGFEGEPLAKVRPHLKRQPSEVAEFHGLLVRKEVFDRLGPLDERLVAVHEHADFCLTVREAGGTVYFEPDSVVAYMRPPPVAWSDIPFFLLRWSDAWCLPTFRYVNEKWRLQDDHYGIYHRMVRPHRAVALMPLRRWARRLLGKRLGERIVDRVESFIVDRALRRRRALKGA